MLTRCQSLLEQGWFHSAMTPFLQRWEVFQYLHVNSDTIKYTLTALTFAYSITHVPNRNFVSLRLRQNTSVIRKTSSGVYVPWYMKCVLMTMIALFHLYQHGKIDFPIYNTSLLYVA